MTRSIHLAVALALLSSLAGCSMLRAWYEARVADSLALQASRTLEQRKPVGVVMPANEGLTHLALRAEPWGGFRARMDARSRQDLLLQVFDMQR